jgi:hypothetical protein
VRGRRASASRCCARCARRCLRAQHLAAPRPPGNILPRGRPPKLLDFGVAKLLQPETGTTVAADRTEAGLRARR